MTTHTVQLQIVLIVEVDIEASSPEEAAKKAKGFELSNHVVNLVNEQEDLEPQWCDFDQATKLNK